MGQDDFHNPAVGTAMTGKERISRILKHQPMNRIGLFEHFWSDTQKHWESQGHIKHDEDMGRHFGFDILPLPWLI